MQKCMQKCLYPYPEEEGIHTILDHWILNMMCVTMASVWQYFFPSFQTHRFGLEVVVHISFEKCTCDSLLSQFYWHAELPLNSEMLIKTFSIDSYLDNWLTITAQSWDAMTVLLSKTKWIFFFSIVSNSDQDIYHDKNKQEGQIPLILIVSDYLVWYLAAFIW